MRGTELKHGGIDYNTERPHSALGQLTSQAFARQTAAARKVSLATGPDSWAGPMARKVS
jgi:hypothetical protein